MNRFWYLWDEMWSNLHGLHESESYPRIELTCYIRFLETGEASMPKSKEKPHHGRVTAWREVRTSPFSDKYFIEGVFLDHPEFQNKNWHTSAVLKREGSEVETEHSRYTLLHPHVDWRGEE